MECIMNKKELEIKLEHNLKWQRKTSDPIWIKKLKAEEKQIRKELAKFDSKPEPKEIKKNRSAV